MSSTLTIDATNPEQLRNVAKHMFVRISDICFLSKDVECFEGQRIYSILFENCDFENVSQESMSRFSDFLATMHGVIRIKNTRGILKYIKSRPFHLAIENCIVDCKDLAQINMDELRELVFRNNQVTHLEELTKRFDLLGGLRSIEACPPFDLAQLLQKNTGIIKVEPCDASTEFQLQINRNLREFKFGPNEIQKFKLILEDASPHLMKQIECTFGMFLLKEYDCAVSAGAKEEKFVLELSTTDEEVGKQIMRTYKNVVVIYGGIIETAFFLYWVPLSGCLSLGAYGTNKKIDFFLFVGCLNGSRFYWFYWCRSSTDDNRLGAYGTKNVFYFLATTKDTC